MNTQNASKNQSPNKRSALLRILKTTTTLPAQVTFYASALGAIALIAGADLPAGLGVLAAGVGVNTLSSILERVARGEEIPDSEILAQIKVAIEESRIAEELKLRDVQIMIAKLFQRHDLLKFTIQNQEYLILQRLAEQAKIYETFVNELHDDLSALYGLSSSLYLELQSSKRQNNEILQIVRDLRDQIAYITKIISDPKERSEVTSKAKLYNVPLLPPHYIARNDQVRKIKALLLQSTKIVGITGISQSIGLQGMGGIGKSIIASTIAYDDDIRYAFPDGIIWVALGQEPEIINIQASILEYLDQGNLSPKSAVQGRNYINKFLADKKVLLILDDVWNIKDIQHFDISSPDSRLLITTRNAKVLKGVGAEECIIDVLSTEQALQLLRKQANWVKEKMPDEAIDLVIKCGALPLAISMIGAMLRGKPRNRWGEVLTYLQDDRLEEIEQIFVNYPYPNLFFALDVSVKSQPPLIQERYLELAVFPEDTPIPESVLQIYWHNKNLKGYKASKVVDELLDASLIFRYDDESLMLHDLQRDYIQSQCADIRLCHQNIIDAYETKYPGGWYTVPYEKPWYFHMRFARHLNEIGDYDKAKKIAGELLFRQNDLPWSCVTDYARLLNLSLPQIANALIKTNHSQDTLVNCLQVMGQEGKEEARRLLKEGNDYRIIIACLNVLGDEVKPDAKRFLKERSETEIIIACLKLLGREAKEDAKRILRERDEPHVINACLFVLGNDAKDDARRLLKERDEPPIITVCLNLLGSEAKEEAHRFLKTREETDVITVCLNLLGNEAKDYARHFLKTRRDHQIIATCLTILGSEAKDDARRLLKTSNDRHVILICLKELGIEAKDDAKRILKEHQSQEVVSACLKLLGEEAKEDAKRLIKERQELEILVACLKLLGAEAKEDAKRLIEERQEHQIITSCLLALGKEARPYARKLLSERQENGIIVVCLKILGTEAKKDAKRLLNERQENDIIITCLKVLGTDAKDEAKRLLKESRDQELIIACLKILKIEAMEDAKRLLQERQESQIITTCLRILGSEAKEEAKQLIKERKEHEIINLCLKILGNEAENDARKFLIERKEPQLISSCLKILGNEGKEEARRLLKTSDASVILTTCLDLLGDEVRPYVKECLTSSNWNNIPFNLKVAILRSKFEEPEKQKYALEILTNWRTPHRYLVTSALIAFNRAPGNIREFCYQILLSWESEIEYCRVNRLQRYSAHIRKSMAHPDIKEAIKLIAFDMLIKDEEAPGFLDELILDQAKDAIDGKYHEWDEPFD